jgi:hypothetical protein
MVPASQLFVRRASRLLLAGLCAIAAGCGGDDKDETASDTEQIAAAVERLLESEKVKDQCETAVSERFVREVYVTLAHCRKTNADPSDSPPDTAKVSATRVDGDRATTGVTLTSVKGSRASGRLALVKAGDTWKVDRLGVDFLRAVFATLPREADTAVERRILRCIDEATRDLPNADVRRIGNLVIGGRLTEEALPDSVVPCVHRDGEPDGTTTA